MADLAGRDINKIHNTGENANNIINTGSQTIDDAFAELKTTIEKEYIGVDKKKVLRELDLLKKEADTKANRKSVIVKLFDFAKKFALNYTISSIILSKIIPLLQETVKHAR